MEAKGLDVILSADLEIDQYLENMRQARNIIVASLSDQDLCVVRKVPGK